jgi:NAD(P)-dependent dehydrogenase (short-subunit alcohol dehydrogenase family)
MTSTLSSRALDGRVAVVTGAASGIGKAIAERFIAEGATVVGGDILQIKLAGPADKYAGVRCDVTDEDDLRELISVAESTGPLSILVNSAGISIKIPIDEMPAADWRRLLAINLDGSAFAIKHAVRAMKSHGGGSIVNIASIAAFSTTSRYNNVYAASKGAIVSLTRALVYELSAHGIRINALAPGLIDAPILRSHPEAWVAERVSRVPLGRMGTVQDMANVATFLASDQASYITGQTIVADGGLTSVIYLDPE